MSLVLPIDVGGVTTSRALARAAIWVSSVFLAATLVLVLCYRVAVPQVGVALALAGLGMAGLSVAWALRATRPWAVFALMLVAGAGLFIFTHQIAGDLGPGWRSNAVLFTMPKIAMTVVGVAGRTLLASLARSTIGFVLASAAVQVATRMSGLAFAFDLASVTIWLCIVLLLATLWYGRALATRGLGTMQAAAAAEERVRERSRVAAQASAALHDTVLNDLHALAVSAPGPLNEEHRAFLATDIAALAHPGLLVDEVLTRGQAAEEALEGSRLGAVIRAAEQRGLALAVSGEPGLLLELGQHRLGALLRAADRALLNVSRYAGVDAATLAVASGAGSVNVVISDAGCGFSQAPGGSDEQVSGLTIRRLIEGVGGTVRIWSTPGRGTAVLMSVPQVPQVPQVRPGGVE